MYGKLDRVVFWKLAHWLARKHQALVDKSGFFNNNVVRGMESLAVHLNMATQADGYLSSGNTGGFNQHLVPFPSILRTPKVHGG